MTRAAADQLAEEGNELFRAEQFGDAMLRFERATQLFPEHAVAWKGLGNALLCLGRAYDAARAFDRAIGLRPDSATALWGGAVAHADVGNKVMAQNYLRRALTLQPTWIDMARNVPQLNVFLKISTRAQDVLRGVFGPFSTKTYRHAADETRAIEVGRIANNPAFGQWTYLTVGLTNHLWQDAPPTKPRPELVLASMFDLDVCGQILANLAFHLAETSFYPDAGVMVRDVVAGLNAGEVSQRLPHVYLIKPRSWTFTLPLDATPPPITLVQVVPVSEAEYQTWRRGVGGFEQSLQQRRVQLADLRRTGT
jgi:tetratricopeptide (TPR) repeat protein